MELNIELAEKNISSRIYEQFEDEAKEKQIFQLKNIINLLLHFRYMLAYLKKNYHMKLTSNLNSNTENIFNDFDYCSGNFEQLINSDDLFDFIRKREQFYLENMNSFYSLKLHSEIYVNLVNKEIIILPDFEEKFNSSKQECYLEQTPDINSILTVPDNQEEFADKDNLYDNLLSQCSEPDCNNLISDEIQSISKNNNKLKQKKLKPVLIEKNETVENREEMEQNNETTNENILETNVNQELPSKFLEHIEQIEYNCSYNNCRYRAKSLNLVKMHEERRHIQQLLNCTFVGCSQVFTTKEELDQHLKKTHIFSKLKCTQDNCGQTFVNKYFD